LIDINVGGGWGTGGLAIGSTGVGEFADNDGYGFIVVAGAKINDMFSVEAGYGYVETEFDLTGPVEDGAASYYLQFPITLAPGVYVTPEVGMIDYDEDPGGYDESDTTYFGAKWQINF